MARTAPATQSDDVAKQTPVVSLKRSDVVFNESRSVVWFATAPRGVTKDQLTQSALWSVVSDQWHPFDEVRVVAADRSFYAKLLVLDCGRGYANVVLTEYHALPHLVSREDGLPPGFEAFYAGPMDTTGGGGWCVRRVADGILLVRGKKTEADALTELLAHATLR